MRVALEVEPVYSSLGPWVELKFALEDGRTIPIASVSVNPDYGNGKVEETGLRIIANALREVIDRD